MMNQIEHPMDEMSEPLKVSTMWVLLAALAIILSFAMVSKENAMENAENVMFEEYKNWVAYTDTEEQDYLNVRFQMCLLSKNMKSIETPENYESWMVLGAKANPYKFFELADLNKTSCVQELRLEAEDLEGRHPGVMNEYKQFVNGLSHRYRWRV